MSVTFYIGNVGESPKEINGTIDDLVTHVNEFAAIEWDLFIETHGLETTHSLRFVCAYGVWRAFTNMPGQIDGFGGGKGGFIAEWAPEGEGGSWAKIRTTAKPKDETPRAPFFMGGER